ncbi:MAG TPA: pyruvate formate lyase family protein [Armatimonadota bacterium]|nr:pyruvate formate lyase family protein [Armatimonadota bacterium]
MVIPTLSEAKCRARIEALRVTKQLHTREKQQVIGSMDHDDWALILPPPDRRETVQTISGSGVPITDVRLKGFVPESNHPSGGFFGPEACGRNFRRLLEAHPPYVDPQSSLLGGYSVNFLAYRTVGWPPELSLPHLAAEQAKYGLHTGIGAAQHFCQDLAIGLELGYGGLLAKIAGCRAASGPEHEGFYAGLEHVVRGIQAWIATNVAEARRRAALEGEMEARQSLLELAEMNQRLVTAPPQTFREACQWMAWYDMAARAYNGSGSLGRLDVLLWPYYERDRAAGVLTDEEAILHLASLLVMDTAYIQLGGYDVEGRDATNAVSYLVLEAAHRLRIPANVAVCVGRGIDPGLMRRGVEVLLADKAGVPKFLGTDNLIDGFARNGVPLEIARARAYSGCHWSALPGREYTLNDCVKVNLVAVFVAAWDEMLAGGQPSVGRLWGLFERHLRRAIEVLAEGLDFHMEHMYGVMPELVIDLLCHGTIERGLDASHGGVDYVNLCVDGAGLATVADSFGALAQCVESSRSLSWDEVIGHVEANWAGGAGERARLRMRHAPRYGSGGSAGDEFALRITRLFTSLVKERPTPAGFNMIPGLFSWAGQIAMGQGLKATPNGRRAGEAISHGANPDPGFRADGAPTALSNAVATVQPGWGNSAPMQIELDPGLCGNGHGTEQVTQLIRTHMEMGGTQININVLDREQLLAAHEDPSQYPDLVVRLTGFSVYFASLSPEFRQMVVDRLLGAN